VQAILQLNFGGIQFQQVDNHYIMEVLEQIGALVLIITVLVLIKIGIWASSTGTSWNIINADGGGNGTGTTTVPQKQWNHIAFVRNGSTWRLYLNGVQEVSVYIFCYSSKQICF